MKALDIVEILSQINPSDEVYIRVGDGAYPAKVRIFEENGNLVPYITIESTSEHRNFPEKYGAEEVTGKLIKSMKQ